MRLISRMRDDLDDHYQRMNDDFDHVELLVSGESQYYGQVNSSILAPSHPTSLPRRAK
jgi:hypothetical protein